MEVPLKSSAPTPTSTLEGINAIMPAKPTPNVWTVMQKWVFALPTNNEMEVKQKKALQKELERTVADLGDKPGLGGDGVGNLTLGRKNQNVSLTCFAIACFWPHGPPQRQRHCATALCFSQG